MSFKPGIVGLRFRRNDVDLIKRLRRRVHGGHGCFMSEMDVYGVKPWLLPHVTDPPFAEKEGYYFVRRKKSITNCTVMGKENGGTWKKSSTVEAPIYDHRNTVVGYVQSFTFNRKEKGTKLGSKTDWVMKEYRLPSKQSQEWVVCRIRRNPRQRNLVPDDNVMEIAGEEQRADQGDVSATLQHQSVSGQDTGVSPSQPAGITLSTDCEMSGDVGDGELHQQLMNLLI